MAKEFGLMIMKFYKIDSFITNKLIWDSLRMLVSIASESTRAKGFFRKHRWNRYRSGTATPWKAHSPVILICFLQSRLVKVGFAHREGGAPLGGELK